MTQLRAFAAGMFAPMRNSDRLVAMKQSLDDLQRQLGTGKLSQTLAGLGAGRSTSLSVRANLAETSAFRGVIARAETRAGLMANALGQISDVGREARREALAELASGSAIPPAAAQHSARARLQAVVAALNEDFDGQFLFSGAHAALKPVVAVSEMLDGVNGAAGLTQMIDERRQADLGDGLGRLSVARSGATVTVSKPGGLPFGIGLDGVASGLTNATASSSGGIAITFAGQPNAGDSIRFKFELPDGSKEELVLVARAPGAPVGSGSFAIGSSAADTAANLAAVLDTSLREFAATKLAAASTIAAAQDFFAATPANPARRIDGPPFATASGFAAPGSRPTVLWYQGEDVAGDPRETQSVQVERGLHLAVGARALEAPFRDILAGLGALAAGPTASETTYRAITQRSADLVGAMMGDAGREIVVEIGAARAQMAAAGRRHDQTDAVLHAALGNVETVSIEQLSAEIVSLQTRLQASYQVTATVGRMSLADYLR